MDSINYIFINLYFICDSNDSLSTQLVIKGLLTFHSFDMVIEQIIGLSNDLDFKTSKESNV